MEINNDYLKCNKCLKSFNTKNFSFHKFSCHSIKDGNEMEIDYQFGIDEKKLQRKNSQNQSVQIFRNNFKNAKKNNKNNEELDDLYFCQICSNYIYMKEKSDHTLAHSFNETEFNDCEKNKLLIDDNDLNMNTSSDNLFSNQNPFLIRNDQNSLFPNIENKNNNISPFINNNIQHKNFINSNPFQNIFNMPNKSDIHDDNFNNIPTFNGSLFKENSNVEKKKLEGKIFKVHRDGDKDKINNALISHEDLIENKKKIKDNLNYEKYNNKNYNQNNFNTLYNQPILNQHNANKANFLQKPLLLGNNLNDNSFFSNKFGSNLSFSKNKANESEILNDDINSQNRNNHNINIDNNLNKINDRLNLLKTHSIGNLQFKNPLKNIEIPELEHKLSNKTISASDKFTEDNNDCSICITNFEINQKLTYLPCMHFFHSNCIRDWLNRKRDCPICKYQLI